MGFREDLKAKFETGDVITQDNLYSWINNTQPYQSTRASFPNPGDSEVTYIATDENKIYRWDSTLSTPAYVEIGTAAASGVTDVQSSDGTSLVTNGVAKERAFIPQHQVKYGAQLGGNTFVFYNRQVNEHVYSDLAITADEFTGEYTDLVITNGVGSYNSTNQYSNSDFLTIDLDIPLTYGLAANTNYWIASASDLSTPVTTVAPHMYVWNDVAVVPGEQTTQADYAQTDTSQPDFIKNKPDIDFSDVALKSTDFITAISSSNKGATASDIANLSSGFSFKGFIGTTDPSTLGLDLRADNLWFNSADATTTYPWTVEKWDGTAWQAVSGGYTPTILDLWDRLSDQAPIFYTGSQWMNLKSTTSVDGTTAKLNTSGQVYVNKLKDYEATNGTVYNVGDMRVYGGYAYRCSAGFTDTGTWNSTKWSSITNQILPTIYPHRITVTWSDTNGSGHLNFSIFSSSQTELTSSQIIRYINTSNTQQNISDGLSCTGLYIPAGGANYAIMNAGTWGSGTNCYGIAINGGTMTEFSFVFANATYQDRVYTTGF